MVKVKILNDEYPDDLQVRVNRFCKELSELNEKVLNVSYAINTHCLDCYSAMIVYEVNEGVEE